MYPIYSGKFKKAVADARGKPANWGAAPLAGSQGATYHNGPSPVSDPVQVAEQNFTPQTPNNPTVSGPVQVAGHTMPTTRGGLQTEYPQLQNAMMASSYGRGPVMGGGPTQDASPNGLSALLGAIGASHQGPKYPTRPPEQGPKYGTRPVEPGPYVNPYAGLFGGGR